MSEIEIPKSKNDWTDALWASYHASRVGMTFAYDADNVGWDEYEHQLLRLQMKIEKLEQDRDEAKKECGELIFREYYLVKALKLYRFLEQTNSGVNPYREGTNRYQAFELGAKALELIPPEPTASPLASPE